MTCKCGHEHKDGLMVVTIDELYGVDIVAEMLLIKEKKSKLSANQRREVEVRYNKLVEIK